MPHYPAHYGDELDDAVDTGKVAADRLDDMAARVLTAMAAVGHLDAEAHRPAAAATSAKHRSLARDAAAAGTVLSRNERGALPLGPDVHRLAVIGVAADTAPKITGGGSALVRPDVVVTPLAALQARTGVDVVFAPGTAGIAMLPAIPPTQLRSVDGHNGWNVAMIAADGTPGPVQAGWEAFIDNDLPAGHGMEGVWSAAASAPSAATRLPASPWRASPTEPSSWPSSVTAAMLRYPTGSPTGSCMALPPSDGGSW